MKLVVNPAQRARVFTPDGNFIGVDSADADLAKGDRKSARLILLLSRLLLEDLIRKTSRVVGHPAQGELLDYLGDCLQAVADKMETERLL